MLTDLLSRWFALPRSELPEPSALGVTPATTRGEIGTRRARGVAPAEDEIQGRLAAKLLHGWLQNRHQTLMPLHVNLTRLSAAGRELIAAFGGLAANAGGDPKAEGRIREWLRAAGADAHTLSVFDRACSDAPPSLLTLVADLVEPDLANLSYVIALVAAQDAGPAAKAFADYIAARLSLPTAALRSAERRYRS